MKRLAVLTFLVALAAVTFSLGGTAGAWCPPAPGEVGNCPTTTTAPPTTTTVPPVTTTTVPPPPKPVTPPPAPPVKARPRTTG